MIDGKEVVGQIAAPVEVDGKEVVGQIAAQVEVIGLVNCRSYRILVV